MQIEMFIALIAAVNSLADDAISKMYTLADAIYDVADALWWMSFWRVWQFTMMLEAVGAAGEGASKLTPAAIQNVWNLTDAAGEYSSIRWDYWAYIYTDPMVGILNAASEMKGAKVPGGSGGGGGGAKTVILELDGKELGRTVEALLGKRNKLRTVSS